MLIRFNALENLKIIGLRVKTGDKLKALSADDGMCRPADIKVRIAGDGGERSVLCVATVKRRVLISDDFTELTYSTLFQL